MVATTESLHEFQVILCELMRRRVWYFALYVGHATQIHESAGRNIVQFLDLPPSVHASLRRM